MLTTEHVNEIGRTWSAHRDSRSPLRDRDIEQLVGTVREMRTLLGTLFDARELKQAEQDCGPKDWIIPNTDGLATKLLDALGYEGRRPDQKV